MPEKVPLWVVFTQLFYRIIATLKTCLRGLAVIIVWLIILPNFTLLTWRFYFWSGENIGFNRNITGLLFPSNTSVADTPPEEYLMSSMKTFFSGCLEGQVITAFVIVIFVAAYLFREWVMQNMPAVENIIEERQDPVEAFLDATQIMNHATEHIEDFHQLENELSNLRNELHSHRTNEAGSSQDTHHEEDDLFFKREEEEEEEVIVEPIQEIQPRMPIEEEEPFDVAEDINGVLEAIGMRGNPRMLIQNSVLMSLMISLCLGIAVWIPYVIGRLVILIRPMSIIEKPIYVMRLITDPLVDFVLDLCLPYVWAILSQTVESMVPSSVQDMFHSLQWKQPSTDTVTDSPLQMKLEYIGGLVLQRWHQFAIGQTGLDRSMCILVGYIVLICIGSWYLSHVSRRRNETTATGESIEDIIRQQGIFLKVLFFILIELVIFPTVCGFLLDMATLPLFANASFGSRYTFHLKSSYSSYFLHWFLGTGVLFYFAIFITVCREIIRPGVMWFIRDPNDPQFHPVQEMVERPLPNLLQKISQSALIYSAMLVFGVGTVTYLLAYTGIVFPLRLPFNIPLSTLAIDLLIIQFLLPPLIGYIKPREYSKKALDLWWHMASRQLRLTSFMFNQRMPDEEGRYVRRTLKAFLFRQTVDVTVDSEVDIEDSFSPVVFRRDGMLARVPKYDSVPVDPHRRMIVPVDPDTLEAIDEEERRKKHPAAADTGNEEQATIIVYIPPYFKQRIIFFLFYMWCFISVFTCSVTVLPLLIGRALFDLYLAPKSQVNDLYSFALGLYVMTFMGYAIYWGNECYSKFKENGYNMNNEEVINYIKVKALKASKSVYLFIVFGLVIPLLFGIAVDLFVFMPFRTFDSEIGLVINLSQNWSFGIAYMSIVYNAIHVLPTRNRLRIKLDAIIGTDIMQTDVWVITRTIILVVISMVLLAIAIPALISWGILQMLDSSDAALQITVTRYTYPAIFGIFVLMIIGYLFKKLLNLWMDTVRDDAYLIGKRLHNMNNESEDNATTMSTGSSSISRDIGHP